MFYFLSVFLSQFTLTRLMIARRWWTGRERHPRQCPEVGAQRGGHDQALRRGHWCDGHLCHICGGDIQRLRFAGRPDPPYLSKNEKISECFLLFFFSHIDPLSSTERQPAQLRPGQCVGIYYAAVPVTLNRCADKPTTSPLKYTVNILYHKTCLCHLF